MNEMDVTVSTGVVFHLFKPPLFVLQEAQRKYALTEPKPPLIFDTDKEREEPNELDPDFIARHDEWEAGAIIRTFDIVMSTGSKVASVPDGIAPVQDDSWVEPLSALDIDIAPISDITPRYIQWVRYVAAPNMDDFSALMGGLMGLLGVQETEVAQAVDSFRSTALRGANLPTDVEGSSTDRDRVTSPDSGSGASIRRVRRNGEKQLEPNTVVGVKS